MERPLKSESVNKPLIGVACAVVLAALGGWYYWHNHTTVPPAAPPAVAAAPSPAPPAEDTIQHPVPEPQTAASQAPLPALSDSDGDFAAALVQASGENSLAGYLVPENLIRHIVVTVDNLPRQRVAADRRPLKPAAGTFLADGDEIHSTLDEQNFQRYAPWVGVVEKIDVQHVVGVYLRFYPLFQKAYQDLGYPSGYFNDRLVQVIDLLLATPQVTAPIDLVRPNVLYVFADPSLESRPAGQKLLIRMGPDNEAALKAKLMELRASITAAVPPKH